MWTGHGWVTPRRPKQRQVLALLILQAGSIVPTASLQREIWGDTPPKTADATLQLYITQVRRFLAGVIGATTREVMDQVLITRHGGYLLQAPESSDLDRFSAVMESGRNAARAGRNDQAARLYAEALGLWDGSTPLAGVPHGPLIAARIRLLQQDWLAVAGDYFEMELARGRYRNVLGPLMACAGQHPLHENLHRQLIRALIHSGQPAEAMAVFSRLRARLSQELGIDPAPETVQLRRRIGTSSGGTMMRALRETA
ncbi:AfsR/SARP family transcriptional regulator [Actinoplanes sp. N902-109]|uniref:AfsR/SARP family transcriptional regulator n=1 Tax=Actinoplanes sp. (strain N902-109) TaxID=649831 RepID=UPI00032935BE|nr:AfsR/SARP family transcriptional regulator [Actinoplanes sp. N902-109]AGL13732.1 hypothetical protein L083_0222 [Actinoplanes sp. N902-109]